MDRYFLEQNIQLATPDGKPADVPVGGAIGLLALGDIGIIAWRQKLQQVKAEHARKSRENLATEQIVKPYTKIHGSQ